MKLRRLLASSLLFLVTSIALTGQSADAVWFSLFNLDSKESVPGIDLLAKSPDRYNLSSFELLLDLFTKQTEESYGVFKDQSNALLKQFKRESELSDFHSEIFYFRHFLYSAIASSHFGDYSASATGVMKSYRAFKRMEELHPAHPVTEMARGFFAVVSAQIPDHYQRLASFAGFNPDSDDGFSILKSSYLRQHSSGSPVAVETAWLWLLCLWEFSEDEQQILQAWHLVRSDPLMEKFLITDYLGLMIAFKTGDSGGRESLFNDKIQSSSYQKLDYFYYQRGKHRLFKLDPRGLDDMEKFISQHPQKNFVKSAWLRMSWYYEVTEEKDLAIRCRQNVLSQGTQRVWADEQAVNEVSADQIPDRDLLELRMLFDGGYSALCLDKSEGLLQNTPVRSDKFMAEVLYRRGRVLASLGRSDESLREFDKIFRHYRQAQTYFVPKSAYLSALMVIREDHEKAKSYLDIAAGTNKYAYRKTLERQIQSLYRRLN